MQLQATGTVSAPSYLWEFIITKSKREGPGKCQTQALFPIVDRVAVVRFGPVQG